MTIPINITISEEPAATDVGRAEGRRRANNNWGYTINEG